MTTFAEVAVHHFDFLVTRYGFSATVASPTQVRYESSHVFFDITTDPRDGICVDFGRTGQPGVLPTDSAERLSLNTFLGAIHTHLGEYRKESVSSISSPDFTDRTLQELAAGLAEFGRGLIAGDTSLYGRARELRFWHVGPWPQSWGTSIVMSADEITRQRRLVPEILSLTQRQ
jgi:hypothetical protein